MAAGLLAGPELRAVTARERTALVTVRRHLKRAMRKLETHTQAAFAMSRARGCKAMDWDKLTQRDMRHFCPAT